MSFLIFLYFSQISISQAYDCSASKPFIPVGHQNVRISVGHFYWKTNDDGSREEVIEDVCSTESPANVPILDIRNREEEWYYCYKSPFALPCSSTYQGGPASVEVIPAIVIRRWNSGAAMDHHFHAYISPQNDHRRYFDLFARSLHPDLLPKRVVIDAAGGGRGENSTVDSFYVKTEFE